MCKKYEYVIGIGNINGNPYERQTTFQFDSDGEALQFSKQLDVFLEAEGRRVTSFDKVLKENIYHVVNRLCEAFQETKEYGFIDRLSVRKEDDRVYIDVFDKDSDSIFKTIDVTGKEGGEILTIIVEAF